MLIGIGASDLYFNRRDVCMVCHFDPGIASHLKRIDGVRDYRPANPQIIAGDRIGNTVYPVSSITGLPRSRTADGLFDRIDTQVHRSDVSGQLARDGRFSDSRKSSKDNQHRT